jgi:tRNA A-37 threonylcarbamoyl transferase component Bud32
MDLKLIYSGTVTDVIKIHRQNDFKADVVRNFAGKDITITIERKRRKRSLMQNAYYFGVVLPMVMSGLNDAGYKVSKESTHEFLKATFNKKELVNESTGEILQTVGSTAQMSTSEMMDYFAEITQWAVEFLNVQIPEPGEQIKLL